MSRAGRDLNALLGSRICHDLISPLGAIGNGLELLSMSGASAAPELALITESVENANARIRFFRVAFGAASAGQGLGSAEIRGILGDVMRGARLSVDWQPEGDCPRREVRLAFLLILCLETAMPWGGRIAVTRGDGRWRLHGAAERMKVDPVLWTLLLGGDAAVELSSAQVQFALAPEAASRLGKALAVEVQPGLVTIGF